MVDFKKKLAKFGKTFKTAKQRAQDEGGFGADLPDGRYMSELTGCELSEAQSSGRLQVGFFYTVTEGEQKGEKVRKYQAVETEDDQVWLARELKRYGIQLDSLEELDDVVKILNDSAAEVKITLKSKDSGQFLYVDKVLSEIDAGEHAAEEGDEEEDPAIASEDEEDETDEEEETEEEAEEEDAEEEVEEEAAEEDEGDDLEIGMAVGFKGKAGKDIEGKVTAILEKEGKVKVKSGDKTYIVKAEDLFTVEAEEETDEEEVEEEEEVETPVGKKKVLPAKKAAPAKKAVKKAAAKKRR